MTMHHDLDVYPVPKDKTPLYINEPQLVDLVLWETGLTEREPQSEPDNVRIYVPIDLNRNAILRRLHFIIAKYGEANEENEFSFSAEVDRLWAQAEIYDKVWSVRHMPESGEHSAEMISLAKDFVAMLEDIPDGCAECFPFEMIDELTEEYLGGAD